MTKALFSSLLISVFAIGSAQAAGDKLNFKTVVDVSAFEGQTFLSFMQEEIKPKVDEYALKGYKVADGNTVIKALDNVAFKVRQSAIENAGSQDHLRALADTISAAGQDVTLYTLPFAIDPAPRKAEFNLATFLGLASGGGVAVKFADDNYAYNIHYGTGEVDKDGQTGRSFGASTLRPANDASDAAYLQDLQEYVTDKTKNGGDVGPFFRTIIETLVNCDTSGYKDVTDFGDMVLTDFLAVYIAEQDRNLMDMNLTTQQWDVSLLEATLLSYFHAGQKEIHLMFMTPPSETEIAQMITDQEQMVADCLEQGKPEKTCNRLVVGYENSKLVFTNKTLKQEKGGIARQKSQVANLVDYWQFSFVVHSSHRGRSGINVTRPAFRALGNAITQYEREKNPDLIAKVESHFPSWNRGGNLYQELSSFLVNFETPRELGPTSKTLSKDFVEFMHQVYADADAITEYIKTHPVSQFE